MTKSYQHTIRIALTAIFAALAYLSSFLFPVHVQFLTLDIKDAIIAVGALYLGPLAGILIALIASLIEMLTVSMTGLYGFLMNFVGSAAFAATAALIYRRKKSLVCAIAALGCAVLSMTAVMLAFNLLVTPFYLSVPRQAVIDMIPTLLLPFNLGKGILNASLTMLLYKPAAAALAHTPVSLYQPERSAKNKRTVFVALISVLLIAAVLLYFFLRMDATL